MFKHYFERIQDIAIWPIISLLIFFIFFVGLLIWVARIRKTYISAMEQLPMHDGTVSHSPTDSNDL
jgi:cytochrome c oxidase cbb3-type subunit IV